MCHMGREFSVQVTEMFKKTLWMTATICSEIRATDHLQLFLVFLNSTVLQDKQKSYNWVDIDVNHLRGIPC
jgi:hypothetical protein